MIDSKDFGDLLPEGYGWLEELFDSVAGQTYAIRFMFGKINMSLEKENPSLKDVLKVLTLGHIECTIEDAPECHAFVFADESVYIEPPYHGIAVYHEEQIFKDMENLAREPGETVFSLIREED